MCWTEFLECLRGRLKKEIFFEMFELHLEIDGVFEALAIFDSFNKRMLLTDGWASSAGWTRSFEGLKPSGE